MSDSRWSEPEPVPPDVGQAFADNVGFDHSLRANLRRLAKGQTMQIAVPTRARMRELKRLYAKEFAACKGTVTFLTMEDPMRDPPAP